MQGSEQVPTSGFQCLLYLYLNGGKPLGHYRVSGATKVILISPTPGPGMPSLHGPCVWFPLAACTGFVGMSTQSRVQYHELPRIRIFVITPFTSLCSRMSSPSSYPNFRNIFKDQSPEDIWVSVSDSGKHCKSFLFFSIKWRV